VAVFPGKFFHPMFVSACKAEGQNYLFLFEVTRALILGAHVSSRAIKSYVPYRQSRCCKSHVLLVDDGRTIENVIPIFLCIYLETFASFSDFMESRIVCIIYPTNWVLHKCFGVSSHSTAAENQQFKAQAHRCNVMRCPVGLLFLHALTLLLFSAHVGWDKNLIH
jgi:hypothetical protein